MTLLSRRDQEIVVLSFEKDYGKIIMQGNCLTVPRTDFKNQATRLGQKIQQVASDNFFEEDLLDFLYLMFESLEKVACNDG